MRGMRNHTHLQGAFLARSACAVIVVAAVIALHAVPATAQVRRFAEMNSREIAALDRAKTVILLPGGILEEHGPYLPADSDGIFNRKMAEDVAQAIAQQPERTAVLLPSIPLGTGGRMKSA